MHTHTIESLESRSLLSATPTIFMGAVAFVAPSNPPVVSGVLTINGSSAKDDVLVTRETAPVFDLLSVVPLSDGTFLNIARANNSGTRKGPTPLNFSQAVQTLRPGSQLAAGPYIHVTNGGGRHFYYVASTVQSIRIDLGNGNDHAVIATNVKLPARLIGGAGNDTLEGGTRADTIEGGAGDDILIGGRSGTSANIFDAGTGRDTIFVSGLTDQLRTADGNDTLFASATPTALPNAIPQFETITDILADL